MRSPGWMPRSTVARVGGAAVAMVLVAEAAVWLLGPGDEPPAPVPVAAGDYFGQAQIERATDYRDGQRWLMYAGLAIEGAVLLTVALGRPAPVRRALARLGARPILGAVAAGAGVSLLVTVVTLPTSLAAHERAVDAGISTQSLGSWAWDVARSAAITAAITAAGAALLIALVRRFPRGWWAPGSVAVAGLAVVFVWIAPVVLAPVFNRFETLGHGSRARAEVLELGRRAGVEIGDVYRVDASRRGRSLNAYVDGIGSTKRVVLYDNLLAQAERPVLRSVVAHELGHVAHDDVPRGIAFVVIVAPLGLIFVRELSRALARRAGIEPGAPAAVPAYLLAITLATLILNVPGNQLSREIEASADQFSLELTDDPRGMIELQRQLARANLSDPDPPALPSLLFGTHPTKVDRIGAALAYEREGRS
ncbi:MAG: M48 family metalloprotease [Solirubrobacterales bacterium]|nr:M48 family metalloprotease [Solirubrobacterales bacterium]